MAPAARLDLVVILRGTLDNCSYLLCGLRVSNRGRGDWDVEVVFMHRGGLVKGLILKGDETRIASQGRDEAVTPSYTGCISHTRGRDTGIHQKENTSEQIDERRGRVSSMLLYFQCWAIWASTLIQFKLALKH